MGLSSPGIGSGLDVNGLVSKLMAIERQPITNLDTKTTAIQAQISSYGTLQSTLATLQDAAFTLSQASLFNATTASSSDSTVFTASTSTTASTGSHSIVVNTLADAQRLQSTAFASPTASVGTGSITFEFGTWSGTGSALDPFAFSNNPDKVTKTVVIAAGQDSVQGVANAINAAKIGVSASVISSGTSSYLMFSPADSGTANALRISVSDDDLANTDMNGLSRLAYDKAGVPPTNMTQTVAAADATLTVDGINVTKSLNTIDDVISGVTLNLLKPSPSLTTQTLTVSRDNSGVQPAVEVFVKAYNDAAKMLADLTAYDPASNKAGALQSEGTVRSVQRQLRNAMTNSITGLPGGLSSLSDIGISFQRDGSVKLNSVTLQSALKNPQKDVGALFVGSGGVGGIEGYGTKINNLFKSMFAKSGLFASRTADLSTSITNIDKRRVVLEARMTGIETRYRTQFTALDTLIASMTATSTFLTQQLASLPGVVTNSSK